MLRNVGPRDPYNAVNAVNMSKLQAVLSTSLIRPGHPEYDDARKVYNRWHDLYPAAIVRTKDVQELRRVIDYARENCVELAIRGGGHHIGGFGTSHGGIVVDFSGFREVDVVGEVAMAQPGARLGDMDRATCPRGMVVPTGTVSDTGIAGLTLGGGIGWLVGQYGLTCDHLVGADVLLADGRVVEAEEEEHRSLLWALRGGGGNFGIVLKFRFALQQLPPTYCGSFVVEWEHAPAALVRIVEYLEDCPRALTVAPTLIRTKAGAFRLSVDFCCTASDAGSCMTPLLRAIGSAESKDCGSWDFVQWQSHFDREFFPPMRGYWKARYGRKIDRSTILALCDALESAPFENSSLSSCSVLIESLHGAYRDRAAEHAAFQHRNMKFGTLLSARWEEHSDDSGIVSWLKNTYDTILSPESSSSYGNYTMSEGPETTGQVTGTAFARLLQVKQTYDPDNVFKRNHNLRPESYAGERGAAAALPQDAGA